ncbi:TPA: hypothetical protein JAN90_16095 [Legionella pneumophila]|uniref:hypothetical protein n=1 Tax=Legionella pneumophila TaxID=446 RepID=UPI00077876BB|nr:hypothetical protein [Legionella pneumophila]HAT8869531.1 hypothetical protein [Legionella pneumophila subsp. pneumophila]HAT7074243.1 hypothetical protein [Legionella pneumophila]HAT8623271.1 hypothetical protein [Legionella pneumophila]HAT8643117.1 hypothetical protein [Legionella pneumophila]HAT8891245.1 hypothetical protein [Legionella pneumophila subsp. pneumophila]
MSFKAKLSSTINRLRKIFFPTGEEVYREAMSNKQPGRFGKFFIALYFPSVKENEDSKSTVTRILNRVILIAVASGFFCIWSMILDLHLLEGIFLIFCMSSIIPYIAYVITKKQVLR